MAQVETIVVGGGINAGTPFSIGSFLVVQNVTPPLAADGNARQDTSNPPKVYIGEAGYSLGVTVLGGAISKPSGTKSHIVIGDGATCLPSAENNACVVIGANAINGTGYGNVVLGDGANASGAGATSSVSVVIGCNAKIVNPAGGQACVVIGSAVTVSLGSNHVAIGQGVTVSANNGQVVIGPGSSVSGGAGVANNVVIGSASTSNGTRNILIGGSLVANGVSNSVALGMSATVNLSNAVFLCNDAGYQTVVIGKGNTSTAPTAVTIRGTNGQGTNVAAQSVTIASGLSTGNAASAPVDMAVGIVGASGGTLQTQQVGARVSYSNLAGDTWLSLYDVDSGSLQRVSVGAPDSGGAGFRMLRIPN